MEAKIAVIGSGMAGLTAAYLCRKAGREVTVFEAAAHRGMDAHRLAVPSPEDARGEGFIDVPLRVMSTRGWRTVLALCAELGVGTFAVDTPISLNWMDRSTWFRSGTLRVGAYSLPTLGALRYLGRETWQITQDLLRLAREKPAAASGAEPDDETIEEFFTRRDYHRMFWRGFILPLLSTISTCRQEHLLRYPARGLLTVVQDILFRPGRLRRIEGGTQALVDRLVNGLELVSGAQVTTVRERADGVEVRNARGEGGVFDRLIIATQANQLGFLGDAFPVERELMSRFTFDQGELVVHRDPRVMPRDVRDWTPLNYLMDRGYNESMFTVWVNPVEPSLAKAAPVFQTWNPTLNLDSRLVIQKVPMQRAVVTRTTARDLADLGRLQAQPERRVFFCGSWAAPGVPLLESAVRSAIALSRPLGFEVSWDPLAVAAGH